MRESLENLLFWAVLTVLAAFLGSGFYFIVRGLATGFVSG
jgi:hypothetical protein